MTTYSEEALNQKLSRLVDTQDSITVLSQWIIYHKKHAHTSVQTWAKELLKAAPHRKLCYIYLANDVIQNSRRKSDDFVKEFAKVWEVSLVHAYRNSPEKYQPKILRILNILEDRNIFEADFLHSIKRRIETGEDTPPVTALPSVPMDKDTKYILSLSESLKRHEIACVPLAEKCNSLPSDLFSLPSSDHPDPESVLNNLENAEKELERYREALERAGKERGRLVEELRKWVEREELRASGVGLSLE
ncbi:Regulation of nuclear pre-mRNA domain containing protein 1B, partial [Rhizophlyctis rosea]